MSLERFSELYYTAAEARAVLGLTEHSFQYWVKAGKIKKRKIPGRRQGAYLKSEVDKLAQRIETAMLVDEEDEVFRQATLSDIEEELDLAHLVFGQRAYDTRIPRQEFLAKNPESTFHLYDHDSLVACINLVPLKHEAILEFREGKRGWLFSTDLIEQFVPGKPLECIIIDMITTPTVPPDKREHYGMRLLMGIAEKLREWGERGVNIISVDASGSTVQGRKILETAGFQKIAEFGNRFIYELDVTNSPLKLLKPHKEAFAQWRKKQTTS